MIVRIHKSLILTLLLIAGCFFAIPHTVYAQQDCPACDKAPKEIETYFAVMKAILNNIPIDARKNPDDTVVKDISAGARAAFDAVAITTLLWFGLPTKTVGDVFGEIKVQFMSKAMRRDRQRYVDMDYAIAQRLVGLQKNSHYTTKVPRDVLINIDSELKKLWYIRLAELSPNEYRLEHNRANYLQIIEMLWKINGFYKTLHQADWYHHTLKDIWKGELLAKLTPLQEKKLGTSAIGERPSEQAANTVLLNARATNISNLTDTLLSFCKYQINSNGERICILIKVLDLWEAKEPTSKVPLYTKIWSIEDAYDCAVGIKNVCEWWAEVRKESFALMKDRGINDIEKAYQVFLDAWSRLRGIAFSPNEKDKKASNKRKEQLTTSYWGPTPHRTEQDKKMFGVNADIEPAPQSVKALWKWISNARDRRDEVFSQQGITEIWWNVSSWSKREIKKRLDPNIWFKIEPLTENASNPNRFASEETKKARLKELEDELLAKQWYTWGDTLDQRNSVQQSIYQRHIQEFQDTFTEALSLQYKKEQNSVFTDVHRVTMQFPALSAAVYKNIAMLGKKNDQGTLYNAMWSLCELQCTNVQGKCRYYTD